MPDKARYGAEMLRVLKPGGILVVADWNQRDDRRKPFEFLGTPGYASAAGSVVSPLFFQY